MTVCKASPIGLCFGVRRAIDALEQTLSTGETVYAIGSPIHNPQEVERLRAKGLIVVEDENGVPDGAVAFIRAHGVAPAVVESLKKKHARVIDGTCPFVRVVQTRARELSEAGYHVLILGDEKHPEVVGILGYVAGSATVISSVSSLLASTIFRNSGKIAKLGLVSQTTQQHRLLAEVAKAALERADELRVFNTICHATRERQQAVAELSAQVDGLIVIGGHDSANTGKLCRIASDSGCHVQWIEHAGQLDRTWLEGKERIGVAAGASTPDWLIDELIRAVETAARTSGGCQ